MVFCLNTCVKIEKNNLSIQDSRLGFLDRKHKEKL